MMLLLLPFSAPLAQADPPITRRAKPAQPDARTIVIEKVAAKVGEKLLDPDNPPPERAKFGADHDAFTQYNFGTKWEMKFTGSPPRKLRDDRHRATLHLESAKLILTLKITLWLPDAVKPKLRAHEEGHRRIAERFYETADIEARRVASKLIGRNFVGEGGSAEEAIDAAQRRASELFSARYLAAVFEQAQAVNELYDDLTEHGLNALDEDEAIEQAVAAHRARRVKKPTTRLER